MIERSVYNCLSGDVDEMSKLDNLGAGHDGITLPYSERTDHKHVTLYTHLNKVVGPMSVSNAKATMIRWSKSGIELFLDKRTDAQVAEYKETPKFKKLHAEWKALRTQRNRSKRLKPEDVARMTAAEVGKAVASEMKPTRKKKDVVN